MTGPAKPSRKCFLFCVSLEMLLGATRLKPQTPHGLPDPVVMMSRWSAFGAASGLCSIALPNTPRSAAQAGRGRCRCWHRGFASVAHAHLPQPWRSTQAGASTNFDTAACIEPAGAQYGNEDARASAGYEPAVSSFHRRLTDELEEQDLQLVPTPEQHAQKQWLASTLKPLLENHSGGTLHTFGSCDNGFWIKGSDVDACLVIKRCTHRQSLLTKLRLVQCLVERERFGTAQVVAAARVPIAKVCNTAGVEMCDISVNNVAALENSRFVGTLAQLDPRVPPLGRLIKHWASRRRINNRSEGTLSTYTLILQLFFFLQTRDPPILPRVVDILTEIVSARSQQGIFASASHSCTHTAESPARAVNAFAPGPEMDVASGRLRDLPFLSDARAILSQDRFLGLGCNTESLGELLHGFFQLWGKEEFRGGSQGNGQTVHVYDAEREVNDLGVLVLRCPLTGKNVNPFTPAVWRAIHAEFERAAVLLLQEGPLAKLWEAAEGSPAGRGPRTRS